ncbi:MAG: hypothetical protein A2Z37_11420 [Chloroflexi bacterium RBG_19FT_COMBO_62_14]|nr:MAG: hypothetical protein A2Z37_11420 [Chloroflexi bacterium RBG_19FT_COMBO_62_14]
MDRNYQRQSGPGIGSLILNLLTLGVLLMTLCAGGAMTVVFINPATIERISPLLPIKLVVPPTLMPTLGFPTSTNTPEIYLPPTWTPTPSRTPGVVATEVPPPTETPTPTEVPLGETPQPSPTNLPFGVQPGNPVAAENSVNELACDYLGIGGQVFDLTGSPVFNLDLHVTGNLDGQAIDLHSLTGTSGVPSIGPGAYLINLADHPIASTGSMQIVLSDTSGTPLSAAIGFDTSGECEFNFVLFNWRQEY